MNYKDENGIAETTDMDVECDENGGKSAPCPIYVHRVTNLIYTNCSWQYVTGILQTMVEQNWLVSG